MTAAERLKKRFKGGVPHIAKKEKVKKDKMKPVKKDKTELFLKAPENNKSGLGNYTRFKAYPYND